MKEIDGKLAVVPTDIGWTKEDYFLRPLEVLFDYDLCLGEA